MDKQLLFGGFLSLLLINLAAEGKAVPIEAVPNPRRAYGGWVTDMADLLDAATEAELNQMISRLEARNGSEMAIVTVPDTAPDASPKVFTTRLFNTWGIGKKGQNNGVLVMISRGDRRVEIETGQGVRALLPDASIQGIIRQQITPQFKQGNFNGGILAGSRSLVAVLNRYTPPGNRNASSPQQTSPMLNSPRPFNPSRQLPLGSQPPAAIVQQPIATSPPSHPSGFWGILASLGVGLSAGGLFVFGIRLYRKLQPLLLEPEGESRVEERGRDRQGKEKFCCSICQKPLQLVNVSLLFPKLSKAQRLAQRLGSVAYEGWQCPSCAAFPKGRGFHIRTYVLDRERFSPCPTCQELTIQPEFQVLQEPTWNQVGTRLIQKHCKNCRGSWQQTETIPCLPLPDDVVLLPPQGDSRVRNSRFFKRHEVDRPTHCSACHYPMTAMNADLYLRPAQQVAQQLGSIHVVAWSCPTCPALRGEQPMHLRAYILSDRFSTCPNCQELTVERSSRVVEQPTTHSTGRRLTQDWCHYCSYHWETWEMIPQLVDHSSHDSSEHSLFSSDTSSSSSFENSSWSSDTSSSSSYDSGSSDFGGGSSDGGGSGDNW
jgi:uncharacterized protein